MSRFVIDCSIAMSWCFEDESNAYATDILNLLASSEAIAPSIWPLEVANVLLVGERRSRLKEAESSRFLALLSALPIMIDEVSPGRILYEIISLGRQHNLSSYDAIYLELAMREGLPLATLDKQLIEAAKTLGVALVKP